jgi:sterol desaturase/sphingolipid hydroxylase (fatty acid hydroxylase superfamily)
MKRFFINIFKLNKREYYLDFFITPPITLFFMIYSIYFEGFSIFWIFQFILGWIIWTLYEYILHRFFLHKMPILNEVHFLHHRNQLDYIAQPPWLTLLIYFIFFFIFGINSSAILIGFSFGYITYAALHTIFHFTKLKYNTFLWKLDQRHMKHHHNGNVCYGITVNWWDKIFKTEL